MNDIFQSIETKAIKYILWNLGSNIRINEIQKQDNQWKVGLSVSFPSEVRTNDGREKTFVYKYNLKKSIYFKENLSVNHDLTVKAEEIEFEIRENFWHTNQLIEKAILKYGKYRWGKIPLISNVLSKSKAIISKIKREGKIGLGDLMDTENYEMAKLLKNINYLKEDRLNPEFLIPTNELNMLFEKEISETKSEKIPAVEAVIGQLIAEKLDILLKEFNYRVIKNFIDIVALYYINTVRFGELISIREEDLLRFFNSFRSRSSSTKKEWSFSRAIEELHIAGLLRQDGNEISGNKEIFEQLMEHKIELLPHEVSVYEMVT